MAVSTIKIPHDTDAVHSNNTSSAPKIGNLTLSKDSQGYYISVFAEGATTRVGFFRITSG